MLLFFVAGDAPETGIKGQTAMRPEPTNQNAWCGLSFFIVIAGSTSTGEYAAHLSRLAIPE